MAGIIAQLTSSPQIRAYAFGLSREMVNPVADFLAPAVEVQTVNARFKRYTGAEQLTIPDTRRAIGGTATKVSFKSEDGTVNCEPHALDFPADNLAQIEAAEYGINLIQEGGAVAAQIAALSHEKRVTQAVLSAAGGGSSVDVASADPIAAIDEAIEAVLLACGGWAGAMRIRVTLGMTAERLLKNSTFVRSRFVSSGNVAAIPALTNQQLGSLLIGNPEVMTSLAVENTAQHDLTPSLAFLLTNSVIVTAAHPAPTRWDPSTFKTFRLAGQWMTPRVYTSEDGRIEYSGWDWTSDVQTTNTAAIRRLNLTNTPP